MSENQSTEKVEKTNLISVTIQEVTQPFKDLFKSSKAMWGINISYLLEGLTYFGVLSLLAIYFNNYAGLNDINADQMVGILTAGITLSMLFLGATVDLIGVRKAFLISLSLMLVGRIFLAIGPDITSVNGLWVGVLFYVLIGIVWFFV